MSINRFKNKQQKEPSKLAHVYCFDNGMVVAFDQYGRQMPDYNGRYDDAMPLIERDKTEETRIYKHGVE